MMPSTYLRLRKAIGSQAAVAALLDVDRTTILRRESGEIIITTEAALALEWLAEQPPKAGRKRPPK